MLLRDIGEARVVNLLACPVQQRDVHHAVDNHPTGLSLVPRANETAGRVVSAREDGGGVHAAIVGFLVTCGSPVGNCGGQPHEAHVVMDPHELVEGLIKLSLDTTGRVRITLTARKAVHLPADPWPKTIGPPVDIIVGGLVVIAAIARDIRNAVAVALYLG